MTFLRRLVCLLLLAVSVSALHAAPATPKEAIRAVMQAQADAWNRGDIVHFMQGYDDSPQTTFVGKTVQHGYATILERYRRTYTGKSQMGQLTFSDLDIRPLDAHIAVVTGRFHLARTAAAGGNAEGVFSLVFENTAAGWKIVLDHTS